MIAAAISCDVGRTAQMTKIKTAIYVVVRFICCEEKAKGLLRFYFFGKKAGIVALLGVFGRVVL